MKTKMPKTNIVYPGSYLSDEDLTSLLRDAGIAVTITNNPNTWDIDQLLRLGKRQSTYDEKTQQAISEALHRIAMVYAISALVLAVSRIFRKWLSGSPTTKRIDPDQYAILGLTQDANHEQVIKAFRSLAKKHHPDKGGDPARFIEVCRAKDHILSA